MHNRTHGRHWMVKETNETISVVLVQQFVLVFVLVLVQT